MTEEKEFYDAGEAAKYLAAKWGLPSYSSTAFKMLRIRRKIEPDIKTSNATLWKRETLEAIAPPDRHRSRPGRRKKSGEAGGQGDASSVAA